MKKDKVSMVAPALLLLECNHYEFTWQKVDTHAYCESCQKQVAIRSTLEAVLERLKVKLVQDGNNFRIILPRPPDHHKAILKQLKEIEKQLKA